MAITWTNQSPLYRLVRSRLQILSLELGRWMHTLAAEGEDTHVREDKGSPSAPEIDCFNMRSWKVVNSRDFGIMKSSVSPSAWTVLRLLQSRGFQAYLVGGCVRDLLLKRTPKDYDVITTASLEEVRKQFHRVRKVGSRFPICWVYIKGTVVEVSSFETSCKNAEERKFFHLSHMPSNCDYNTLTRWRNCFQRDFTVNSLFYDPCTDRIYDYVDGIRDVMTSKIRTVIPAHLSFEEDSARILRGLRIAARLGLVFSKETEVAIRDLSSSVITLDKSKLMMEMNFMMAYGSAGPSICLLQKFKLLECLLPIHAVYLSRQPGSKSGLSASMLMELLCCMDKLFSADRPCDCSLWLSLLAFHLALLLHPQDALIVWTFSSILYYGGWKKAVEYAKKSAKAHVHFVPEIISLSGNKMDEPLLEEVSHLASLVKSSISALTNSDALLRLMGKFQGHACSGLVFVPKKMGQTVAALFGALETDIKSYAIERQAYDIDFDLLKKGDQNEIRFVLGKVIIDAMNCGVVQESEQELVLARDENGKDIREASVGTAVGIHDCQVSNTEKMVMAFND